MDASKREFANYAWNQGNTSTELFENLAQVEEMVKEKNTEMAVAKVQSLFNSEAMSDNSTELIASEMERFGSSCSPVRSTLIFALAAVKYGKMCLTIDQCQHIRVGLKWCMSKIFYILKLVKEIDEGAITTQRQIVVKFIVELSIATYESVQLYFNPLRSSDIAASALQANYLAISCNFAKDRGNALKYARRALDLMESLDTPDDTDFESLARIYQTVGICERKSGDWDKGTEYLRTAEEFAKAMEDYVPNKAKKEILKYIRRDLDK